MTVEVDILEGTAASHDLVSGWEITRIAIVTGLSASATSPAKIAAAETAVIAVTGDRGAVCPTIAVPTYLVRFVHELVGDGTTDKVKILYKGYPRAVYEFDGSLNQVETNLDSNGDPIEVSYTYPANYPLDEQKRNILVTQGGFITRAVPEPIFTVRWVQTAIVVEEEPWTATDAMTQLKLDYEGKVNDAEYSIGRLTGSARTWLIEKISGTTRDGGLTYEAAMTFHYRGNTWDTQVTFINPDDGLPPADLIANTGYKIYSAYPTATFPSFSALFPAN